MYTEPTIILPDAPADILIPEPRIVRPSPTIAASRGPLIKIPRVKWERDPAMSELIDHFDEPGRFHDNKKIKTDADRYQLLTVAEIQTIQTIAGKCRDDFSYASRNFFWITNKRRGEQLFRLWESQELIYEHLQRLKAKGMLLKIMILKARQLGALDPDSKVLRADLTWDKIDNLKVGDEVISVDENVPGGKGSARKMRTATVLKKWEVEKEAFRITFEDKSTIIATGDHPFLVKRRGSVWYEWKKTAQRDKFKHASSKLSPGDEIRMLCEPWETAATFEDGWFAGLVDGEGSFRNKENGSIELCVCQVEGAVLDRAKKYLDDRGYKYRTEIDDRDPATSSKLGDKPVHKLIISGSAASLRAVGILQPSRFQGKRVWEGKELPNNGEENCKRVVSVEFIGIRRMVDIETSTSTFIAAGLITHNCSTLIEGLIAWKTMFFKNVNAIVVSFDPEHAAHLFGIMQYIYDRMPWWLKPQCSSREYKDGLRFENPDENERRRNPGLNSQISVQAANKRTGVGQGTRISAAHLCFSGSVQVITGDSVLKRIRDVTALDTTITSSGQITRVKGVYKSARNNEETAEIRPWGSPFALSTTLDHRILTPDGYREADSIQSGDWIRIPVRPITNTRQEVTIVHQRPGCDPSGDGRQRFEHRETLRCNYSAGWLFGLYLAEGSIGFNKKLAPQFQPCRLFFGIDKDEETHVRAGLTAALGDSHKLYSYRHKSRTVNIAIGNSGLARFVNEHFGYSDAKRVPDWAWECGEDFCRGILIGYLSGDGHIGKGATASVVASSIRAAIVVGMRGLSASLGLGWGSLYTRPAGEYYGRNCKEIWTLAFSGQTAVSISFLLGAGCRQKTRRYGYKWRYAEQNRFIDVQVKTVARRFSQEFYDLEVEAPEHNFCTLQACVTNSEYSDWNQDYARDVIEEDLGNALAEDDPDMFAILESTAKGTGNYSYTLWKKNIELAENAEWYPLFLPFFFESTRFIAPAAGWRPEQAETDMRERVKVDWLRCNNRDCLQYHERFHKIEDMSETPCPTCGTGVLYPFELSDGQLRWMQRKRKNAEKDLDSLKKLRQEMCCVTGDARLSTDQGIIRFDEAREIRVVDTGAVTAWLAKGIKPVGEIATKRGRSIKTTHDHQIALTDGRWVEAKDLVTGDRIVMAKPVFASDYFTIRWNVTPYVESSLRVDEAFGRALGYYMGDGCWKGGGIYIACDLKDTDVIDDVKAVLERVSGVRCVTEVRGGMELVNSNSVKWLEVMTAIGGLRKNNGKPNQERLRRVPAGFSYMRKVCVPDCIWRSPRSVVKEFLSALFECDAHAYKESPKTTFFTKWEGFARDVQLLLLGFGINARISHEDKVNGEGRTYIGRAVIFTQEASNIFHRDIGFIGNRKRTTGCVKEEGKYTKGRALFRNEMYDEFVSFTPCGEEEVYDLTVPGAACFGANGMLVHNSTAIEAFQTSGIQVFGEAAQEFANHCVRPPKKEGFLDKAGKMHGCNPYNRRLNSATGDYYEACYLEGCNADHTWGDEHNESPLQIWREPEKTGRYVIGADVAEGLGGEGDFSVGFVLKVSQTGGIDEQVAMFRSNLTDTIAFAHVLNHLGRAYCGEDSGALIAVENNKYDTTLTHLCFQLQYPNLYRMKNINFMNPQTNKLGWSTQANSKPRLWQTFKRALQQKLVIVYSQVMAEEMKTFVKEDYSTRTTGSEGESHDDALMAGMIALYCAHENDWDDSVNQMNFRRELTLEEAAWHFSCDACSLVWPEAQTKDAQQCPRCKSRMIRATPNRDAVTADKQGNPFLAGDINRYEAQEYVVSMELSEKKMPEYEDL